ncbi:hypothetical protein AB0P36_35150 [Streptomyces flavidovirens]|uniref:hypothetical protein n=1 Tax=Streptomyces flavidovirens TaxID=67298 RepID=UPI003437E2B2
MNDKEISRQILEEGIDDWIPIDRLIDLTREFSEAGESASIQILESLLDGGFVKVGEIGENGFEAWSGASQDVVLRVAAELEKVNWVPLGGVCWIANTPKGDAEASHHQAG